MVEKSAKRYGQVYVYKGKECEELENYTCDVRLMIRNYDAEFLITESKLSEVLGGTSSRALATSYHNWDLEEPSYNIETGILTY